MRIHLSENYPVIDAIQPPYPQLKPKYHCALVQRGLFVSLTLAVDQMDYLINQSTQYWYLIPPSLLGIFTCMCSCDSIFL